ncbi:hypothetical protein D3C76_1340380 [compost metagenome]
MAASVDDTGQVAQYIGDVQRDSTAIADHRPLAIVVQALGIYPYALAEQGTGAVLQPGATQQQGAVALNLPSTVEQLSLGR